MARKRTSLDTLFTRKDEGKSAPDKKNEQTETRAAVEQGSVPLREAVTGEPVQSATEAVPVAEPEPEIVSESDQEQLEALQEVEPEPEEEPVKTRKELDPEEEPAAAVTELALKEGKAPEDVGKDRAADSGAALKEQAQQRKRVAPAGRGEWEYRALQVFYDQVDASGQTAWDYVIDFSDGSTLVGLNAILNAFARKGWELVNVFPSYSAPLSAPGESFAMELRIILKRRLR